MISSDTLYRFLQDRSIAPDHEFIAAAGSDYGAVEVWEIGEGYLVHWGNNGGSESLYTETDPEPLEDWLMPESVPPEDWFIVRVNLTGSVPQWATHNLEAWDGPFLLVRIKHYYGPRIEAGYVGDDGEPLEFDGYAEALEARQALVDTDYRLSHNESSPPQYFIVKRP